ncbi:MULTISPECIES: ethanolamine ammonia-lyase reactivating factor EutA [Clostridia]|uniref:ethanolamine ammonia-lyase reactivating factor EutA n=1 Tax=Clostridia TaxID=186801 RepID=UPI0018A974BB|nr:ethanolamine ammonia-lyase reactivating factor EutA [Clostridium sp. 1001270J_160509_D11]
MNNKFVSIVIDKEEGSRFLVSDDRSIDTVDLSNDKQTSIARINIKDDITTVCRYENGESKGTISLNIGKEQVKIDSSSNKITYVDNNIRDLARLYSIDLNEGETTDVEKIRGLCKILADIMITTIHLSDYSWGFSKIVINGRKSFEEDFSPSIIIFTGIAAKYIFNKNEKNVFEDGNIGMLLCQEINNYSKNT